MHDPLTSIYCTERRAQNSHPLQRPASSPMPQRAEIWYFEDSLAAPVARPLGRRYSVRALPARSSRQRTSPPDMGDAPVVCLADLGADDLVALRRIARRAPRVRVIGISRNGSGQSAPGCFATLPRKANRLLVRKTVD